MASRFEASHFSNPDREEPAQLILLSDAQKNPTTATDSSVRWEAKDGKIIDLAFDTHEITIAAPANIAGIRLKPGTFGYKDYIEAMASDWDANASMWQTYVNWPEEREQMEAAKNKALQAMPEKDYAIDSEGNPVRSPRAPGKQGMTGLYIAGGILGAFVIGGVIYSIIRSSKAKV